MPGSVRKNCDPLLGSSPFLPKPFAAWKDLLQPATSHSNSYPRKPSILPNIPCSASDALPASRSFSFLLTPLLRPV